MPVPWFPLANDPLTIRQHTQPGTPFTVAGECGAFFGEQSGSFEAWVFPVKLLSHFTIEAHVDGYDVPIDVNADAAEIEVAPDHTTITYSHIAFTLKEILFAPRCGTGERATPALPRVAGTESPSAGKATGDAGVMALFSIDSVRPVTLTFSFTPEVEQMWPALNYGPSNPEWVNGGYYLLHTNSPALTGAVGMPGTQPGILAPYQEKPKTYPLQFVLRFDPKRDSGKYFPLVMAVAHTEAASTRASLGAQLSAEAAQAAQYYTQTAQYYAHFFDQRATLESPDKQLDQAFRWAEISIDQLRVRHGDEVGLVAGFYSSGDSARPGFGWYFGRDTLYSLYAVNSYGDFALSREAIDFLLKRQRDDGKMMHEYSETADLVDWKSYPYEYAAADATPLFLMAMEDYVDTSGDLEYLHAHWAAVEKAWNWETTHDSDGDGILDNSQGTGWVESWPPGMPHQEIYLAALDEQASGAMARLSTLAGREDEVKSAGNRARDIAAKIEQEYAQPDGMYAFSRNPDGTLDRTATIYPSVAWWDGHFALKQPDAMFKRWASHEFSTDWGTRDLGEDQSLYDPISYHQGSVWPLFTGWTSVAEYRSGRPLAGYAHVLQNAQLTWAQDLGAVTELLSGAYFVPFGRSSSHQLWSSAMVITPQARGMFGLSWDATQKQLTVDPQLPATWGEATLHNLHMGATVFDLHFVRQGRNMHVTASPAANAARALAIRLRSTAAGAAVLADGHELKVPLPAVEVGLRQQLPLPGSRTQQMKVLAQTIDAHGMTLELEAQGGSEQTLELRQNEPKLKVHCDGGEIGTGSDDLSVLHVRFPSGQGYQLQTVRLSW